MATNFTKKQRMDTDVELNELHREGVCDTHLPGSLHFKRKKNVNKLELMDLVDFVNTTSNMKKHLALPLGPDVCYYNGFRQALESAIDTIKELDPRCILIFHGLSGIGKTTLATVLASILSLNEASTLITCIFNTTNIKHTVKQLFKCAHTDSWIILDDVNLNHITFHELGDTFLDRRLVLFTSGHCPPPLAWWKLSDYSRKIRIIDIVVDTEFVKHLKRRYDSKLNEKTVLKLTHNADAAKRLVHTHRRDKSFEALLPYFLNLPTLFFDAEIDRFARLFGILMPSARLRGVKVADLKCQMEEAPQDFYILPENLREANLLISKQKLSIQLDREAKALLNLLSIMKTPPEKPVPAEKAETDSDKDEEMPNRSGVISKKPVPAEIAESESDKNWNHFRVFDTMDDHIYFFPHLTSMASLIHKASTKSASMVK